MDALLVVGALLFGILLGWVFFGPVQTRSGLPLEVPPPPPIKHPKHWYQCDPATFRFQAGLICLLHHLLKALPADERDGSLGNHVKHLLVIYDRKSKKLLKLD